MNKSILPKTFSLAVVLLSFSPIWLTAADKVAKAVMLKGQVKAKSGDAAPVDLKQDDWVSEGTLVQTADKSFVKLQMQDQSSLSLGPNSKMLVGNFPKGDPGLIKLINGQLKSQVTKDPGQQENKLIIKTKTAAMGVRGTSLMVVFNNENQQSSTVTFEGEVAMAHLDPKNSDNLNGANALGEVLSGGKSVLIHEGQFSGCGPGNESTLPQKMSPAQFDSLANNDLGADAPRPAAEQREYQSPVPPNVDTKDFANTGEALTETLAATAGADVVEAAEQVVAAKEDARATDVPPEGVYNAATGEFAPPAGGFIDLNTGLYVPPPPGSTFDSQAGVFIPPPNLGTFDPNTGAYLPPPGTELKPDGSFAQVNAGAPAGAGAGPAAGPNAPGGAAKPATGQTPGGTGPAPVGGAKAPLPAAIAVAPAPIAGFGGGVFDAAGLAGGTAGGGEFFAPGALPPADMANAPKSIDNPDVFTPPVLVTPIPAGLNQTNVNINVNVI